VDWQLGVAAMLVVLAAAYVARATWRTWHPPAGGCGGGCCGKAAPAVSGATFIPAGQLGLLRRPPRGSP
jgi:hypothetical protein